MARYTAISLLDKLFIFRTVFKSFPLFPDLPHLYVLQSVKALNVRLKETHVLSISYFLRANYHAAGFPDIEKAVNHFVSVGYLELRGISQRRIYITELGKAALIDLETVLRTSHFKFRRTDDGRVVIPGRKKGRKQ